MLSLAAKALQHDADFVLLAEKCRRVARRMSFTTFSADSFTGSDFCLHLRSLKGYDEPEILVT